MIFALFFALICSDSFMLAKIFDDFRVAKIKFDQFHRIFNMKLRNKVKCMNGFNPCYGALLLY